MSWWKRAKTGTLPTLIVGGRPVQRCPDCRRTWTDPEAAFAHVMAGCPERRRAA